MKKLLILGAALALGSLTGCAIGGGGGGEAGAIENAKMQTIASVGGQPVTEGVKIDVGQDNNVWNNAHLSLTTKQKVLDKKSGKDYDVDITWTYEEASFLRPKFKSDETHEEIYFNYSKTEEYDFKFTANLTCGSATGTANYEIHLLKNNLTYDTKTIKELYEVDNSNKYGYKLVETAAGSSEGYYKGNNTGGSDPFYYAETYAKVVYYAPDGNFALVADGDYFLELFAGKGVSNLKPTGFPALTVGNTVKIIGEMTSYFGSAQMAFIKDIDNADASKAAAPADFKALAGSAFAGKHYWEDYLVNSARTVSATYNGNLKFDGATTTTTPDKLSNSRWTFEVLVDGEKLLVAYDYHTDPGDKTVLNSFKEKLTGLEVGSPITVKGFLRFAGPVEKSYKGNENSTDWSICPFLAGHLA